MQFPSGKHLNGMKMKIIITLLNHNLGLAWFVKAKVTIIKI